MTDLDALTRSWCLYVAGRIGINPPSMDHMAWLRLHHSEAEACMESTVYGLMLAELGDLK